MALALLAFSSTGVRALWRLADILPVALEAVRSGVAPV